MHARFGEERSTDPGARKSSEMMVQLVADDVEGKLERYIKILTS
jgi:hypothetical protein